MARTVRTVTVFSCGSSEHAERLPSKADTTIWQVYLKCTLTFICSYTRAKKPTFLQFKLSPSLCSYHFDHVHRPRHEQVRKQVRNLNLSCGGFLKRCMLVSSMKTFNPLFLHWFQKIRQILWNFVVKRDLRNTRQSCVYRFWSLVWTIPFATLIVMQEPIKFCQIVYQRWGFPC